jgi:hypothetical protein
MPDGCCAESHRRGEAAVFASATTSDAIGDPVKGDGGAGPNAGISRSPDMNRKSLFPGATGDRRASLERAGFSAVAAGTGDLQESLTVFHVCKDGE